MKKTLIIIDYVKSINFYLNQKLLVKYNILGKILKIEFSDIKKNISGLPNSPKTVKNLKAKNWVEYFVEYIFANSSLFFLLNAYIFFGYKI